MKSLKILITTVILGTSSLALAQPFERDHREHHRIAAITLANNLEIGMRQPAYLSLNGSVQRLRFDADEGHAYIHSIVLVYANGSTRTMDVRQRVTSRSMPLTIDIDGRATGVYIYGSTRGRGSLDVVGLMAGMRRW